MMLAKVIIGNTIEMDRDNPQMAKRLGGRRNGQDEGTAIKAPPFLNANPPLYQDGSGAKYNTITGFTQTDKPTGRTLANGHPELGKNPHCPRSRVWYAPYAGAFCCIERRWCSETETFSWLLLYMPTRACASPLILLAS
eukprot:SAG22_NODE_201_length_15391_cov_7.662176_4_plen_139_part_00